MRLLKFIMPLLLIWGCKKGDKATQPEPVLPVPVLVAPAANESCYNGTIISNTQSEVTFSWQQTNGAKSYLLTYVDMLTGTQRSQSITTASAKAVLDRFKPYKWTITAVFDNGRTTISEERKFYNAGPSQTYYAPYPAYLMAPELGKNFSATDKVVLQWQGSSTQNNITGYDVYYGVTTNPPLNLANTAQQSVTVNTQSGKTYYWKVVTRDASGNTSESLLYEFTVR